MHWDTFEIQILSLTLHCSKFCWIFLLLEN